ncbi:uncharacterized protein BX663DRAFT_315924 [Cokeromyces recurvatus]|uniref:uncharacterized protein n=1 Tax=Cokeromyces recurvatus TaxID=90255 RepID=UPI002220E568|nr:uncharacterized protein BX663DRAFT_315924 [Cokeromyces recurvatus]KAI7905264.1 hypothetical protein BX663DRAFT_315924 [Cokeromyces recurvatus]
MSGYCSSKFMCQRLFRSLFTNTIKPNVYRRKLSSSILDQTKKSSLQQPLTPSLYEYNKLIREYAKTFKKREKGQLEAISLLEEMKEKGVQPNSQTYLQLIMGLSRQRHRSHQQDARLERWFNEFFALEIKNRHRPLFKIKKAFHTMSFRGHPNMKAFFLKFYNWAGDDVDVHCWHYGIAGCLNAKKLADAEELLHLSREKKKADIHSYQILIESYLHFRDIKSASRIFSLILEDKLEATYYIYAKFIEFYTTEPASPDIFNTLNRLWQALLITIPSTDWIPNDTIELLISYYQRHGQLAFAEQLFLDVKSRQQRLNSSCLIEMSRVIIGFADKKQLRSALSLCYDMLGEGYRLSHSAIYRTISACIKVNDQDAVKQLLNIMEEHQDPNAKIAQMYYNGLLAKNESQKIEYK